MKLITISSIFFLLFFFSNTSYSEDALTIKQQLDRIMQEVKDLNKAVFNKSFDKKNLNTNKINDDAEKFTSIDVRIYDLEKDIKNLTLQFEEILFKLDDLSNNIEFLEMNLTTKIENIQKKSFEVTSEINNEVSFEKLNIKEDNTLGNLVISDDSKTSNDSFSENLNTENVNKKEEQDLNDLTPEEQLQFALDQMMKKNYSKSKQMLEKFIVDFPDSQLSGSAHFWLGKIYLFEKNYRKAAIVYGEGVQRFPKSIKAAEMYYELAKSLKEMNKTSEACKTFLLLEKNHKGNKFTKDPEKIKDNLNCNTNN